MPAVAGTNIFSGITVDWGFTAGDIFTNGMGLVATLSAFVLLGIAIKYVPVLIKVVKDAVSP